MKLTWTLKLTAIFSKNSNSDACLRAENLSNVAKMSKVQLMLRCTELSCSNSQWESRSPDAPVIQLDTARNTLSVSINFSSYLSLFSLLQLIVSWFLCPSIAHNMQTHCWSALKADHLLQSSSGISHYFVSFLSETPHDAQNEFDSKTPDTPDRT